MFSGPELARMLITYAASRALGYEHGGSLEFSMNRAIVICKNTEAVKHRNSVEARLRRRRGCISQYT